MWLAQHKQQLFQMLHFTGMEETDQKHVIARHRIRTRMHSYKNSYKELIYVARQPQAKLFKSAACNFRVTDPVP